VINQYLLNSSKGSATPETMDLKNHRMSVYSEGETADKIE